MDDGFRLIAGIEEFADPREGQPGIVGQKQGAAIVRIGAELAAGDDHAGVAVGKGLGVPGIAKNGQLAGRGIRQLRDVVNHFVRALRLGQFGAHNARNMTQ